MQNRLKTVNPEHTAASCRPQTKTRPFRVILTSPYWCLNGVNAFSQDLVRDLNACGIPSHILLTRPWAFNWNPWDRPSDIDIRLLPVQKKQAKAERMNELIRHLERNAPCVYIPNYDYGYSRIASRLSSKIIVVGIVHSDDPEHYDHVKRLGRYWNRIVCVSKRIREKTIRLAPHLRDRIHVIPYGIPKESGENHRASDPGRPLRLIYSGRLVQYQKRVLDLIKIAEELNKAKIPYRLTLLGDGAARGRLLQRLKAAGRANQIHYLSTRPRAETLKILAEQDILLLPSAFEGLPISVIEAMSRGCVPLTTQVESGIPELIENGRNGYWMPIGSVSAFVRRIQELHDNRALLEKLSQHARQTIHEKQLWTHVMTAQYMRLFREAWIEAESGQFIRPNEEPAAPPPLPPGGLGRIADIARMLCRYFQNKIPGTPAPFINTRAGKDGS